MIRRAHLCPRGAATTTALVLAITAALISGCTTDSGASTSLPPPDVSAQLPTPPLPVDTTYRSAVEQAVATGIGLAADQIRAGLGADPDTTLMTLAKPRGLTQDRLAGTIRAALRSATERAVRSGGWTASQAARMTGFWSTESDPDLIVQVSRWFRAG